MRKRRTFYCSTTSCPRRWKNFRRASERATCPKCRARATELKRVTHGVGTFQFMPDVPEHFNISLNMGIRSRAHLRQVQAAKGCQDWEGGVPDPPSDWR